MKHPVLLLKRLISAIEEGILIMCRSMTETVAAFDTQETEKRIARAVGKDAESVYATMLYVCTCFAFVDRYTRR